jgi:hypothetical protein
MGSNGTNGLEANMFACRFKYPNARMGNMGTTSPYGIKPRDSEAAVVRLLGAFLDGDAGVERRLQLYNIIEKVDGDWNLTNYGATLGMLYFARSSPRREEGYHAPSSDLTAHHPHGFTEAGRASQSTSEITA